MSEPTARRGRPRILAKNIAETVDCPVWLDGALMAPASGTFSLFDESGVTVTTGAVVVVAQIATYPILASHTSAKELSDRWREEWSLVIAGVTRLFVFDAYLARRKPYPVVTDADLIRRHSDLADLRPRSLSSYQPYLDEAWDVTIGRLLEMGVLPQRVVTPWSLRGVHLLETMVLICRDFASMLDAGDRWDVLGKEYREEAESAWGRLTFRLDDSEDGTGNRRDSAAPVVFLSSTPAAARWGGIGGR